MGKFNEAEPYQREALEGRRRVLGDDHPDTLGSINNMGALLLAAGKSAEAEPYYRAAMEGHRRILGDDHPSTLTSISNLGFLLKSMGKLTEAEPFYLEALERRRRVLGDDHLDTMRSINNMGAILLELGRYDDASDVLQAAEPAARRVWTGANARWLGNYLAKLGEARAGQDEFSAAEKTLLEAYGILSAGFGEDHKRTMKTVERLVSLYDAWHTAEPNEGFDANATEWRTKLLKEESKERK